MGSERLQMANDVWRKGEEANLSYICQLTKRSVWIRIGGSPAAMWVGSPRHNSIQWFIKSTPRNDSKETAWQSVMGTAQSRLATPFSRQEQALRAEPGGHTTCAPANWVESAMLGGEEKSRKEGAQRAPCQDVQLAKGRFSNRRATFRLCMTNSAADSSWDNPIFSTCSSLCSLSFMSCRGLWSKQEAEDVPQSPHCCPG
ncbi:hypothetical protein VTK56DRAFT_8626 [Thermocarpiscus australiensis]